MSFGANGAAVTPNGSSRLEVQGLQKSYGSRKVGKDVLLQPVGVDRVIPRGDMVGVEL